MKAHEIQSSRSGIDAVTLVERPTPALGPGRVLVRMRALSLNYRDLPIVHGVYGVQPKVPISDGAGEIVAVGKGVTRWQVGDRVMGNFLPDFVAGPMTTAKARAALGGSAEGVAAELVAFGEEAVVAVPTHLSWEEASTLPIAAVTAWNALFVHGGLRPGETLLTLGTGGVSIFALQLAKRIGARVALTSHSDEKLARARALGADLGINYRETPDWDEAVRAHTQGEGADLVLDLGGARTLATSIRAARTGGRVAMVGVVTGPEATVSIPTIMGKGLRLHGISVGSRESFEAMNRAFEQLELRPVIDRVFAFDALREALAYLESGAHFGKVVVTV
ncbi:MAG: NAD(P)-dependent alcohol dehydrogenase [Polyangiaceae bacterium]|nr:NAD(P)-dependent alcohol dehydrogenase [Polyangiaceae bacterium]